MAGTKKFTVSIHPSGIHEGKYWLNLTNVTTLNVAPVLINHQTAKDISKRLDIKIKNQ